MNDAIMVEKIKVNLKGQICYLTVEELKQLREAIDSVIGKLELTFPHNFTSVTPEPYVPDNGETTAGFKWIGLPYTIYWGYSNMGNEVAINFMGTGMS